MSSWRSLSQRKVSVLRCIVEVYLETARPVGSQCVAGRVGSPVSSATIRTIMGALEEDGLLFSAHCSAGRIPTAAGMRVVLENMSWSPPQDVALYAPMENHVASADTTSIEKLEQLALLLAQLSQCMGVVWVRPDRRQRTIIDVSFRWHNLPSRVSCVITLADGSVIKRVKPVNQVVLDEDRLKMTRMFSAMLIGRAITEVRLAGRPWLPSLTDKEHALWLWILEGLEALEASEKLIIRGQSRLLKEIRALEELVLVQELFCFCEKQGALVEILQQIVWQPSAQILIGSQDFMFHLEGCAVVLAPYETPTLSGVVGVAGLQCMDYHKLVPMVEYTANLVKRTLS